VPLENLRNLPFCAIHRFLVHFDNYQELRTVAEGRQSIRRGGYSTKISRRFVINVPVVL